MFKKIFFACLFSSIIALSAYFFFYTSPKSPHKVLICGVCKDIAKAVPNTIKNMEALGNSFKDYRAIVYENNSSDNTSALLSEWAKNNRKVVFMTETLPDYLLPLFRTEKIGRARNALIEEAKKEKYQDFEYFILVDLDFLTDWPIAEIVETLHSPREWDCVSANSLIWGETYWDRYAYRNRDYPLGPELLGNPFWDETYNSWFTLKGDDWIYTYAGYGGLALFKRSVITKFSFSGTVTRDLEMYNKQILASLPQDDIHLQQYFKLNGMDPHSDPRNVPIIFQPNSDIFPNYPHITCIEFSPLFASMAIRGYNKFYINPKMRMRYQH